MQKLGFPCKVLKERTQKWLERYALIGFEAAVEALYPENELGAPSWIDSELMSRVRSYWQLLPPETALVLKGLYASLELGNLLHLGHRRRFSKCSVDERVAILRRYLEGPLPMRFYGEAIKSSSSMLYMSHPLVLRYIGASKACGETALHGQPLDKKAFLGLEERAQRTWSKP